MTCPEYLDILDPQDLERFRFGLPYPYADILTPEEQRNACRTTFCLPSSVSSQ